MQLPNNDYKHIFSGYIKCEDGQEFKPTDVRVNDQTITIQLYEEETILGDVSMREIRRLSNSGLARGASENI